MRGGEIPCSVGIGYAYNNHFGNNRIAIYLAQLLDHSHHRFKMTISIQKVNNRVTLSRVQLRVIYIGNIYPNFALLFQNGGIDAVYFSDYNLIIYLCLAACD